MHGRKREEYKAMLHDPNISKKHGTKAKQFHAITKDLRQRRLMNDTSEITLSLTEKILIIHPDPLTLWNQRREILLAQEQEQQQQKQQSQKEEENQGERAKAENVEGIDDENDLYRWSLAKELQVTQAALESNPKAYGAWFHRKWCLVEKINSNENNNTDKNKKLEKLKMVLQGELQLTELFLKRDERNFHGWNYRRFVVGCLQHCCSSLSSSAKSSSSSSSPPTTKSLPPADGSWGGRGTSTPSGDGNPSSQPSGSAILMGAQVAVRSLQVPPSSATTATKTTMNANELSMLFLENMELLHQEWDFTKTKIQDNFSNFSAFHYRSKLLPMMMTMKTNNNNNNNNNDYYEMLHDELSMIENAIFTEPDDQTAWWYHHFLLDFAEDTIMKKRTSNDDEKEEVDDAFASWNERLHDHVEQLRELTLEQSTSKWVWLGLVQVLERLEQYDDDQNDDDLHSSREERIEIWKCLVKVDPDRKERYRQMLSKLSN